ncbi:MAG: host specificity protein, partial [Pseudomonadota bacterium]
RKMEARRVETGIYRPTVGPTRAYAQPDVPIPAGMFAQFLDLPLLRGDETAHAPWLAASATPWRGPVNVFMSASDAGYRLNSTFRAPSVVGDTLDDLQPAQPWTWSRQPAVHVKVYGGVLQSRSKLEVLNGANTLALRASGASDWEIVQFRDAELVGTGIYALSGFLRGQAGTEFLADAVVPAGADLVLLDSGPGQIDLAPADRGLTRNFRVGPARLPYTDPAYLHFEEAFDGVGLRPYAPVHVTARRNAANDLQIAWIRRTRRGGDVWTGLDVPLAEESEAYMVRVTASQVLVREWMVETPQAAYSAADQTADGIATPFELEIAQVSAGFGTGPFARITVDD